MHDNLKQQKKKGKIFVVSAPSGAGKTSICTKILNLFPKISYSISHTTRSPRNNEQDGVDYFFIAKDEFKKRIDNNYWAEWAKVHDNYYGTSLKFIKDKVLQGESLMLDIDVQGAKQITKSFPEAITIFIMPPSFEVLEQRLRRRGTDSEEVIEKRLKNAVKEIEQKTFYKHIIVNDDLNIAVNEMTDIISA